MGTTVRTRRGRWSVIDVSPGCDRRTRAVAYPPPVDVRVLGPLEVEHGGRLATIGSPQLRLLLARLAVAGGRVVSAETLAHELLGDSDEARRSLKTYVSRLRKELVSIGCEDGIQTVAPGYALAVQTDDVDGFRFERLAKDPATGREALALWRGEPFADVPDREFVRLERMRLTELRLTALEALAESDVSSGGHAQVVADLEVLVREHPLRERFWALLMLALYRSGRQAEALRAYQAARGHLVEELGVEPGAELRDLEAAIIRHDPTLGAPTSATSDKDTVRVLLVDDHPMWRDIVRSVLTRGGGVHVVGEAGTVAEALRQVPACRPDVVLMDLELPDGTGAEAAMRLRSLDPAVRVLMVTASQDTADVLDAVRAGAVGYVVKSAGASELADAVAAAAAGGAVFTGALAAVVLEQLRAGEIQPRSRLEARERSVLRLLGEGLPAARVAAELGIEREDVAAALRSTVDRIQGAAP